MKGYYGERDLKLTGKGWEVREKLRSIAKRADPDTTLGDWLRERDGGASGRGVCPRPSLTDGRAAAVDTAAIAAAALTIVDADRPHRPQDGRVAQPPAGRASATGGGASTVGFRPTPGGFRPAAGDFRSYPMA